MLSRQTLTRLSSFALRHTLRPAITSLSICPPCLYSLTTERCLATDSIPNSTTPTASWEESHSDFLPRRKQPPQQPSLDETALDAIKRAVSEHPVLLYMKGSPALPRCGFSANVCKILQHLNASFSSVDVLEDDAIRQAIKHYSDWPTLPQLYIKGEFVGGSDIISQLFKSGELKQLLKDAGAIQSKSTEQPQS